MTEMDHQLVRAFEQCALPPGAFHHREHVRVAWSLLREQSLDDVIVRFSNGLRRFAAHAGRPELFHATITWAFLFAINERLGGLDPDHTWEDFERANPDLTANFRRFLERYYTPERLDSDAARRTFLLPDRGVRATERSGASQEEAR